MLPTAAGEACKCFIIREPATAFAPKYSWEQSVSASSKFYTCSTNPGNACETGIQCSNKTSDCYESHYKLFLDIHNDGHYVVAIPWGIPARPVLRHLHPCLISVRHLICTLPMVEGFPHPCALGPETDRRGRQDFPARGRADRRGLGGLHGIRSISALPRATITPSSADKFDANFVLKTYYSQNNAFNM